MLSAEAFLFYLITFGLYYLQMDISSLYQIYQKHPDICTDTRRIRPGCIFVALKGDTFDGNQFATEALRNGAAYAMVSDPSITGDTIIYFHDTLLTLQELATYHRLQFQIPFLSITGSNGKTTTKELVSAVLASKYKTHFTTGNLNNHIGVPLTILGISNDIEMAVIEMGANHIGEIKRLCEIARPTHGLITNIGKAHLEGFGSIEGVQQAKGELFDYLKKHDGHAFVNTDDPRVSEIGKSLPNKTSYGFDRNQNPDLHFNFIPEGDGFVIENTDHDIKIVSSMFGHYNAVNMAAAYSVGIHFNVPDQKLIDCLSSFIPGANRSEILQYRGCTFIKDAYNANPSSMELALKAFSTRYPKGRVILGDMKELGEESLQAHIYMIDLALSLGISQITLIGPEFKKAIQTMTDHENILPLDSIEDLKKKWNWDECKGDAFLLKGSRSMHLEKLLDDED